MEFFEIVFATFSVMILIAIGVFLVEFAKAHKAFLEAEEQLNDYFMRKFRDLPPPPPPPTRKVN